MDETIAIGEENTSSTGEENKSSTPNPPDIIGTGQHSTHNEPSTLHTRPETLQRIMLVQQWLVNGMPPTEIVRTGMKQWGVKKSMMYNYISSAYKEFRETTAEEMESLRQFHIEARMGLYWDTMKQQQNGYSFAALQILRDVAKLQGLYQPGPQGPEEPVKITLNLD